MSTTPQLAGQVAQKALTPRRNPRFPVAIPIDVTVLRFGVPDSVPGRSLDLGEGGLALVLAGELRRGEPVGIEFRLPDLGSAVQSKAVVRYEAQLRYGLEFMGLAEEQRAMIRYWAATSARKTAAPTTEVGLAAKFGMGQKPQPGVSRPSRRTRLVAIAMAVSILIAVTAVGSWHWHRSWQELESQTAMQEPPAEGWTSVDGPIRLPAAIVERSLIHRVEPIFPADGSSDNRDSQAVVVLDVIIAANGTVTNVRPISGPQPLIASAVEAVKWWRFQPYHINGRPVNVETTVAIDFHSTGN
jgi:Gram-negative bacterial TonB protein C-terminal/PilZ domain